MSILNRYEAWATEREAIFTEESDTGHLDHDRIWASDDDGCDLADNLATALKEALVLLAQVTTIALDYTEDDVLTDAQVFIQNHTEEVQAS